MSASAPPAGLVEIVDANAPYWAAEAEVCRTYFDSPERSAATDLDWLMRQAAKEIFDGVLVRAAEVHRLLDGGGPVPASALVRNTEELHEEAVHYQAFARAHEWIRAEGGGAALDLAILGEAVGWPENLALRDLRAAHRSEHGRVGRLAGLFTEGGYCTLFAEGMRLAGRGGSDDQIAGACALVHDDEFDHMLASVVGVGEHALQDGDWSLLTDLTTAQSRQRILMRNAQFGAPVAEPRLGDLLRGQADPVRFDWARARTVAGR
jgi:hypothetical protein